MGKNVLQYPAPRNPEFMEKLTKVDQLMPYARKAVARTDGRGPLGRIKPGQKVLLIVTPGQDKLTLEAIKQAFKEKGVEARSIEEHEVMGVPIEKLTRQNPMDGWMEVYWRDEVPPMLGLKMRGLIEFLGTKILEDFLDKNPEYAKFDKVVVGPGGDRFYRIALGKYSSKYEGAWNYDTPESLQGKVDIFPNDAMVLIEKKIIQLLYKISNIRITDPLGTDVSFSLTPGEAKVWGTANPIPGHIYMYPLQSYLAINSDPSLASAKTKLQAEGIVVNSRYAKAEGVIAGTANHVGYFPHMRSYLKDGLIYKIEGGGKFGDLLREFMEKTKNVHYPGYPKPGNLYLIEVALGTCPKYFRRRTDLHEGGYPLFVNVYERQRSGVLHWGIGVDDYEPEFIKYANENKLPRSHVGHAGHTYFNTVEATLRDTGERIKIIDKGRLTVLDDPEVRSLAAKHGDPDEILREEWIPAIPGINYPGDYMRDYAKDPGAWVMKEVDGQLPATIGVPK